MAANSQIKEEFYVRRVFNDEVPVFVDATKFARLGQPYPLSAKKSLKATCGVRTDDAVVAFSLRNYTGKQAEKEIENVERTEGGKTTSTNLLRPHMPRKTLRGLTDTARALSSVLGNEVVAELNDELFVFSLTRTAGEGELKLAGKLTRTETGYERSGIDEDVWFELPVTGVRLRVFLRSPVRDRILAYGFSGYLTRKPGEVETITRATALALNSILGLAAFKLLSGLGHVDVPALTRGNGAQVRKPSERVSFGLPVMLFTEDGTPAARGRLGLEIDLDTIDPITGGLQIHLAEGDPLEWNPAVEPVVGAPGVRLRTYERVLVEAVARLVHAALGEDVARDIAYDIMLSDLAPESAQTLRSATENLPGLAAKPTAAEVQPQLTV